MVTFNRISGETQARSTFSSCFYFYETKR